MSAAAALTASPYDRLLLGGGALAGLLIATLAVNGRRLLPWRRVAAPGTMGPR